MVHGLILRFLALLVLPVTLLALAACGGDDDDETVGPEEDEDVEDVTEDEDAVGDGLYYEDDLDEFEDDELVGETVTVSAEIDRVLEDGTSFVVGEEVVEGGLLVLVPPAANVSDVTLEEGADVQIEGEVTEFAVTDIETEYEPFDLDDELYTDYEEENALVAQSIHAIPSEDTEDPDNGDQDGTTTTSTTSTTTTTTGS